MNKTIEPGLSIRGFLEYLFLEPHGIVVAFVTLVFVCVMFAHWAARRL